MQHAFTVDVEDYYHTTAFERVAPRTMWCEMESRVVGNTHRILDLLARHAVRGTFFILGWVAQKHLSLVHTIHAAGHEIGSHSYWHRRIGDMTVDEFRRDLVASRDVLQEIIGAPVTSYRAPSFSVMRKTLWALDVLAEEGFQIDSSIYPVFHDRYGLPGAPLQPHLRQTTAGCLWECPPATVRLAGCPFPVGGGGYLRLLPWTFMKHCWGRIAPHRPIVFYVHPWEIDADPPHVRLPKRIHWRQYRGVATTFRKLERLLRTFPFGTLSDALIDFAANASMASVWKPKERCVAASCVSAALPSASDRKRPESSAMQRSRIRRAGSEGPVESPVAHRVAAH